MNFFLKLFFLLSISFLVYGCNNTKYLPPDQKLYTGAEIKIKSEQKVQDERTLKRELSDLIKPSPNTAFLGLRPALWIYNKVKTEKKKGFKYWLKYKIGESPVLYNVVKPEAVAQSITAHLKSNGYFNAETQYVERIKKKQASLVYEATLNEPYIIRQINLPSDTTKVLKAVRDIFSEKSLLKEGDRYQLKSFLEERNRIGSELRNQGYYYFNSEFLVFKVDTTLGEQGLAVYIDIKPSIPDSALRTYTINEVYIHPAYSLTKDTLKPFDTLLVEGVHYLNYGLFKPKIITRSVHLKKGEIYSREMHERSLSHLIGLQTFKFVNIKFSPADTSDLDVFVYLTPMEKRTLHTELKMVSKSNNFVGPGIEADFRNRNFLKGAEQFVFRTNFSFETQFSGEASGLYSYALGTEGELTIPRFILPFRTRSSSLFIPQTKFNLGYQFLNRVLYYQLNSFHFVSGYNWKETITKEHSLNPVFVNYIRTGNITPLFDQLLNSNPTLKQSFGEQFILGGNYSFTYHNQIKEKKNVFYFNGNLDFSGNLPYLASRIIGGDAQSPFVFFGIPFSQYSKFETDFRYYHKINERTRLATRLIVGLGLPYGNSTALPYTEQFTIGGVNSIRAFRARSIGPGTYRNIESDFFFIDQTGDIKLEGNIEYRFGIIKMLKGAVFLDAGNIWLLKENADKPGGYFRKENVIHELALGTGIGIRLDLSFFVLRFDLGVPLRKPYLLKEERWVFNAPDSAGWLGKDLVLNVAIGYSF